jgi:hypothetical protein
MQRLLLLLLLRPSERRCVKPLTARHKLLLLLPACKQARCGRKPLSAGWELLLLLLQGNRRLLPGWKCACRQRHLLQLLLSQGAVLQLLGLRWHAGCCMPRCCCCCLQELRGI